MTSLANQRERSPARSESALDRAALSSAPIGVSLLGEALPCDGPTVLSEPEATLHRSAVQGALALTDQLIVSGTNFVATVMVGRLAGADELGVYSLGFTAVVLAVCVQSSLISIPLTVYGNRLSGSAWRRYCGSSLLQALMLAAAASVAMLLSLCISLLGIGPPEFTRVAGVLAFALPLVVLREFARRFAFARLHMGSALALDASVAAVQLGVLFAVAWNHQMHAATAHAVMAFACLAPLAVWFGLGRTNFEFDLSACRADLGRNWRLARWIFASQLLGAAGSVALPWLLVLSRGTTETGVFAACMTIVLFSNPLLLGASNLISPRAARAFAHGGAASLRKVVAFAMATLAPLMLLFVGAVALLGEFGLHKLYPDKAMFYGHGVVLLLLALTSLCGALGMPAENGLCAMERPDLNFRCNVLGLSLAFVVVALLVGGWGIAGAACGLLAGEIATMTARVVSFALVSRKQSMAPRHLLTGSGRGVQ